MRRLFEQQLAKATRESGEVDLEALTTLVVDAYETTERERTRSDGAMSMMIDELGRVHQRLLDAIDVIPEGIVLFDAEDRFVLWNRHFAEMHADIFDLLAVGARFEDVVRDALRKGRYPAAAGREEEWLAARMAEHRKPASSQEYHLPGNRWIRVEERRTADGGSIGVRSDITESKRREESFRLMFEGNPVAMWVLDEKTRQFLAVNDAAVRIYGYSREQFMQMTALDIRPQEDWERFNAFIEAGDMSQGDITWQHKKADGSTIFVNVYGRAFNYQGRAARLNAIFDVTERKRADDELRAQKLLTETAVNNMTQGLLMFDAQARLLMCTPRYIEMYGLSRDVVKPGCTLRRLMEHRRERGLFIGDPEQYCARVLERVGRGEPSIMVVELPDGRFVQISNRPVPQGGWVATHEDVTERKRAEDGLQNTREFLNSIVENVPASIIVKDARELRYVLINKRGEEYFGIPREQMLGKTAEDVFNPETAAKIARHDQELLQKRGETFYDEHAIAIAGQGNRLVTARRLPVFNAKGEPQYLLGVMEDVTDRREAQARAEYLARHDPLTDLPNRAAFNDFLAKVLPVAGRHRQKVAVLSLNLDHFTAVNDVFGHSLGDALLRELGKRFKAAAPGAFLARLGGDEFGLVITEGPQPDGAEEMAAFLQAALQDGIDIEGRHLQCNVSIGVAIYPDDGRSAEQLLANTAAALSRAKREGRGSMRFFEADMDERQRERRILQNDLRGAIANEELTLHYQPQARVDGAIIGFEALARWQHPIRGMVPPGVFIPLAEESGLIVEMGEYLLRSACREAASWPRPLNLAINLSAAQFQHGDLVALVHEVLLETGLSPSRLELEITESVLIGDFDRGVGILRRLKALGVRIAMDDFGTGYSSLSYLQAFPFDKIKIDRSFVANLDKNPQSAAIIRAVIGLGRGLSLPVIAEGVETAEQLEFLALESCDEVQGYLIGKPLPIADYASLLGRAPEQAPPLARAS
ncbi:MAG TPA: EAL domain-containing protein [Pseudolabrys sp.]|nr:EAL domain-containing protein [Pseudolabrys sp.]